MTRSAIVLLVFVITLSGCTYAISPDWSSKADTTITFGMLQSDPDAFKGRVLILGGTIAAAAPIDQGTLLEVEQKPLDYWGKPKRTDATGGRFLVSTARRLNPLLFTTGRTITVAAEVAGLRSPALGGRESQYPVLEARELRLWEQERRAADAPQWVDPLYDPSADVRPGW